MKDLLEHSKGLLIIGGIIIILIIAGLFSFGGFQNNSEQNTDTPITSVVATKKGSEDQLIVFADGRVEIRKDGQTYSDYWEQGKVSALIDYYSENYSSGADVNNGSARFSYNDDELIDAIVEEGSGGNGGGGGNGGQDISDFFNTPTPAPSGGVTRTPTPRASATPAGTSQPSWCLYWRLSYCVIKYQTPSPSGPSPTPGANILAPNCSQNTITGRTVIGNELCLLTPSPTPSQ